MSGVGEQSRMNVYDHIARIVTSVFANRQRVNAPDEPCFWQTDIHSHLLPGVDDGVQTEEQTLEILRQLEAWGIRRVITTPHVNQDWYPNMPPVLAEGEQLLRNLVARNDLKLSIDVAAEYLIDDLFLQLLETDQLRSFGTERFLLIETGWASAPHFMETILFRIQTKGYKPILAHPERYPYYFNELPAIAKLRDMGCLLQLNWGSMTGRYGSKVKAQAHHLLKNKWIDFIGSDLHRPTDLRSLETLFTAADYQLLRQQPLRNHLI